jgi:ubiquinone/menaquinone biosynthesis C-methylase UbiE
MSVPWSPKDAYYLHAKAMPPRTPSTPPRIPSLLPRVLEPEVMESEDDSREYDEMDHDEVNQHFAGDLLELPVELSPALDVGTGPAHLPIVLCRRVPGARIVGIDLSEHMLVLGRRNVERAGLSGAIRLVRQDGKALEWDDASFRCVLSNGTLHHAPHPEALLTEMTRVLAPGGFLFVRDLARPTDENRLIQTVQQYAGSANERQREMYAASLHASLRPEEVASVLGGIGVRGARISMTSDRHWTLTWKKP